MSFDPIYGVWKMAKQAKNQKSTKSAKAEQPKGKPQARGPRDSNGPDSRRKAWAMMLQSPEMSMGQIAEKIGGIKPGAIAAPARWLNNLVASIKEGGAKARKPEQLSKLADQALGDKGKGLAEKYNRQFAKARAADAKLDKAFNQAIKA